MYPIISLISFCIRAWLCYNTIDNIPILSNQIANSILLEVVSLYTILMVISRAIVGIFYKRGEAPVFGAIAYFFIYIINLGIMYLLMLILTKVEILPINISIM